MALTNANYNGSYSTAGGATVSPTYQQSGGDAAGVDWSGWLNTAMSAYGTYQKAKGGKAKGQQAARPAQPSTNGPNGGAKKWMIAGAVIAFVVLLYFMFRGR